MTPTREQLDEAKALSLRLLRTANNLAFLARRGWFPGGPRFIPKDETIQRVEALHGEWQKTLDAVRHFLLATNASREPVTVPGGRSYPTAHEAVWELARRALSMELMDLVAWPDNGELASRIELEHASAVAKLGETSIDELPVKNGAPTAPHDRPADSPAVPQWARPELLIDKDEVRRHYQSIRHADSRTLRRFLRKNGARNWPKSSERWYDAGDKFSDCRDSQSR